MAILDRNFFNRDTLKVARDLLGCKLNHKTKGEILSGIIVETEAYTHDDPACHASRGKTPRSATLFEKPGTVYVYLIYGMYHCLNFVTEEENTPGAVLIRALQPISPLKDTSGPGKLCREMNITKELNNSDGTDSNSYIWAEPYQDIQDKNIIKTTRIGIKKAVDYPWRFYIKNNAFVSRK